VKVQTHGVGLVAGPHSIRSYDRFVQLRGLRTRARLPADRVLVSKEELGESPLWPALAILGAAALYATMPARFVVGPSAGAFGIARWLVPGLTIVLLATLLVTPPHGRLVRSLGLHAHQVRFGRRVLVMAMTAIVSAANAAAIILLVHLLVNGAHTQARLLLRAGIHMWCLNVLIFTLWFWELDQGGPAARRETATQGRDFLFPQQAAPEVGPPGWRRSSSTISTSRSRMPPRSARPTRCRSAGGRRC
jgi:hypothetical protein